jgi:hypothetical protein
MSLIPAEEVLEAVAETAARHRNARTMLLAAVAEHGQRPSPWTRAAVADAQREYRDAAIDVKVAHAYAHRNGVPV